MRHSRLIWWPEGWVYSGCSGERCKFADDEGIAYRVVAVDHVDGMPLRQYSTGRKRNLYYACRAALGQQNWELVSIHNTAHSAKRACERDAFGGRDNHENTKLADRNARGDMEVQNSQQAQGALVGLWRLG
jgi:hypothetical protein